MNDHPSWQQHGQAVLQLEMAAIAAVERALDSSFDRAVETILAMQGRLVVVGMGKSGIIGRKIAASFASTGTPSFFVHAAEALHGDLGMITRFDVLLAISHSGETAELCALLPTITRLGTPIIAITGNIDSTLAHHATIPLHLPVTSEACPMNLAPTASTTATLALGDALMVVTLQQRGFKEEDFARVHPAGALGRRLLRVDEVMHSRGELPLVTEQTPLKEAILVMSRYRLGITGITHNGTLCGCMTDGDLRRILEHGSPDLNATIASFSHGRPHSIAAHKLASEAVLIMEQKKITALFVNDESGNTIGIIHLHDLLQRGVA
ncbi:MAG: KpsF/GutQ family sugar-phosphate isomerase [Mariprofundales bacterium]|nr:KpsF/GutQ family sugar-phosphate isomerase [Mariprofundales bacterium]